MRLIIAVMCLTLCIGSPAAQAVPEWTGEKHDLDSNSCRGSATIAVDKETVALGEPFSVDIRFLNRGAGDEFYNPFLGGGLPRPAILAIFNSEHKYLGDLIQREETSRVKLGLEDWTFVPTLCYVGCVERLTAGHVPATAAAGSRALKPGEYFVQMIYVKSFLAKNSLKLERKPLEDDEKMFRQFERTFDRSELFRSSVVKVRFTAK